MNRRRFILQGSILTTGYHFAKLLPPFDDADGETDLYSVFKDPSAIDRPYVRWWWNGDKVERDELSRELRLLQQAGIGGIEINPIKFPARTNDLGKKSLPWLSPEWIDMLNFSLDEAKSLGMTCDLIVGSGWPFGAEWLEEEERSQAVVVGTKKLEGPLDYEISLFELFKEADPTISSPFPGREMEMLAIYLAPSVINNLNDVTDFSNQIVNGTIRCKIPQGKFVLYALVRINSFMQVIQGAPGATGPVLDHYNKETVKKYLDKMSGAIQGKIGPLSSRLRCFFSDSLELEGANWCTDMRMQFRQRRGYDLLPWLPFVLYKITAMGNTWDYDYGAELNKDLKEMIQRVRYDFELTKAELIRERFVGSFIDWCKQNKLQSRLQAYGRGYFPLDGSFEADIPECETWIRPGVGSEMSDTDYRIGRAYTMINKYVSSAAHLKDKRHVSCEELTNIHMVFNESLELMKIAGDQSIVSGTTHPIFHGFNYSPLNAPYPGWVIYGTFINERNPWWPYFRQFTDYKARLSALLQRSTMFADIAVLPPTADLWSIYGAQNDPFPSVMYPEWQTLVWESIHQNGSGCDYISEHVMQDSNIQNGYLEYGSRRYHSLFLTHVQSIEPSTAKKLFDFVTSGGRVFFIEIFPARAPGWKDREQRDREVQGWISKMRSYPDRCVLLDQPGSDFTGWFKSVQHKYEINPYVTIDSPVKFVTQVRYQSKNVEILVFINSNMNEPYQITITPSLALASGKQPWLWNPETGLRYKMPMDGNKILLNMGPADLKLIVFDKQKKGPPLRPSDKASKETIITSLWILVGEHVDGRVITKEMDELKDLKNLPDWVNFCGTIIYRNNFMLDDKTKIEWLDLGKTFGVSELIINGENAGAKWYGRRVYSVGHLLKRGNNEIKVKIVTTMGNYLKSLTDNPVAQYWTNEGRTIQPLQSMGVVGPVTLY